MQGRRHRCAPLDNLVYRRTKMAMDTNYPKAIRDVFGRWEGGIWQTLPDKLDTALTWPNQQIFFFKVIEGLAAERNEANRRLLFCRTSTTGKPFAFNCRLAIRV